MADDKAGRPNQKRRTRKDLLQAAARLLKQGREPSLEEIAAEAMVSRATAYRYFPNVEALLIEAPLDVAVPDADTVFHGAPTGDAVARLDQLDTILHDTILANESAMRMMLAHSLKRGMQSAGDDTLPTRQNRRTPLIEAALEPAKKEFKPADFHMLSKALALIIGTESMVVFKDVLQSDDAETRKVKRWAIRALVNAARKPARGA